MTHRRVLVTVILAVGVSVTLPTVQYAPATMFALKLERRTIVCAFCFVAAVTAVVRPVTNSGRRGTVSILALEGASSAVSHRASVGFVGTVFAIFFSITFPEPWDTFFVATVTPVLSIGAIDYASLHVSS